MTDEEYVFRQDVREKKRTARGAHNRKGTRGSRKCTMPSDYMTRKEKLAMNGDVKTLELNRFYTYGEFKLLSVEFQKEWLKHIVEKYDVSVAIISTDVFNIGGSTLSWHLANVGIKGSDINPNPKRIGSRKTRAANRLKLIEDVKKARESEKVTIDVPKVDVDILNATAETVMPVEPKVDGVFNAGIDPTGSLPELPLLEAKVVDLRQTIETPPAMAYAEIGMDGFDMELIELLRNRFKGKKIHVILKVADVGDCEKPDSFVDLEGAKEA